MRYTFQTFPSAAATRHKPERGGRRRRRNKGWLVAGRQLFCCNVVRM